MLLSFKSYKSTKSRVRNLNYNNTLLIFVHIFTFTRELFFCSFLWLLMGTKRKQSQQQTGQPGMIWIIPPTSSMALDAGLLVYRVGRSLGLTSILEDVTKQFSFSFHCFRKSHSESMLNEFGLQLEFSHKRWWKR